jgi:membrane protease YdiL (CAAX protease family)
MIGGIDAAADRLRGRCERSPVLAFFAITCAFSWSLQVVIAAGVLGSPLDVVFLFASIFGPAVGAVVVLWLRDDDVRAWLRRVIRPSLPAWLYAVGLALPVASVLVHAALLNAAGVDTVLTTGAQQWITYAVGSAVVALIGGGQEEFGWRGFALPHLQQRLRPAAASVAVGAMWGLWHVPAFYLVSNPVPGTSAPSPVLYVLESVALAYLLTLLFNAAGGSVVLTMLIHAGFNGTGALYDSLESGIVAGLGASETLQIVTILLLAATVRFGLAAASRARLAAVEWTTPSGTGDRPADG